MSSVLEDAEELWMATWHATPEGQSVVFASHQDEREIWPVTLLRAIHEANFTGFADAATRWRSAKVSKHVGASLRRWFEANADRIR